MNKDFGSRNKEVEIIIKGEKGSGMMVLAAILDSELSKLGAAVTPKISLITANDKDINLLDESWNKTKDFVKKGDITLKDKPISLKIDVKSSKDL